MSSSDLIYGSALLVSDAPPNPLVEQSHPEWYIAPSTRHDGYLPQHPSGKSLILAIALLFATFGTCLVAGTHFAAAYQQNESVNWDEFLRAFTLIYRHPPALAAGLPFALTLLAILLAHELGHFFACRHHHIRASYPFFIPFPTLIGTMGAFILIRSPIRTVRALFDVGASGPLVGFVVAVPALMFGILHAKVVPGLSVPGDDKILLGSPLLLHLLASVLRPGVAASNLLLHPVGRAAWVGLFATSLNLLPAAQLDGGHILRSLSQRAHRIASVLVPALLIFLGYRFWAGWYVWGALLIGIRLLRSLPIYHPEPLGRGREFAAFIALLIFLLCFMPSPFIEH